MPGESMNLCAFEALGETCDARGAAASDGALAPTGSHQEDSLDSFLRAVAHAPCELACAFPIGSRLGADGRYELTARLGRGGMGTVYAARDALLDRSVALKLLDDDVGAPDGEAQARLLREARIVAGVEHERIARVYDVGRHDGVRFVAMELVRGTTLRRYQVEHTPSAGEIVAIATQIAEGLAALHAVGIIHRDLKPENVMLRDGGGIKLLDFGLARQTALGIDEGANLRGAVCGTPGYMAPEQYSGDAIDARADVFAFGVVVYELVTRTRPFQGSSLAALLVATREKTPDFSSPAWNAVPRALATIVARALSPCLSDRFRDGADLLAALAPRSASSTWPDPSEALLGVAAETTRITRRRTQPSASPRSWLAVLLAGAVLSGLCVWALTRAPAASTRPVPAGMVPLDVGSVLVGRSAEELERECNRLGARCVRERLRRELPAVRATLPAFAIDAFEVTNQELAETLNVLASSLYVVEDEEHHYPRFVRWNKELGRDGEFLVDLAPVHGGLEYGSDQVYRVRPGHERLPAVQLSWFGAKLHCERLGKRLPTEDEWEAAARGRENRRFPWGDRRAGCGMVVLAGDGLLGPDQPCNEAARVAPVGAAWDDLTPTGIHDLGGNVAEWTASSFAEGDRSAHPEDPRALLPKVIRGGSWGESFLARTSARTHRPPRAVGANLGFRCATSLVEQPTDAP